MRPTILKAAQIAFVAGDPAGKVINAQPGLRNLEPRGVLIDRITVECDQAGSTGVLIELKWRDQPITGGFVPTGAISWPINRRTERGVANGSTAVIEFSHPIYLPASEYISVAVQNTLASGGSGLSNVNVVAIGRVPDFEPSEKWLPYLSAYLGPVYQDNTGGAISDQSGAELSNPLSVPIEVERLIGRVLTAAASTGPFSDTEVNGTPIWLTYLLRLSDHLDHFWTPFATPLPIVFNALDRSWILNRILPAKGFLRVEFEGTANVAATGFSRATVGLVGYRRIA